MLLNERGGELYSGHRALGRALGCSPAHVGNVLRELANAGSVTVQATKMGTVVRLAA
jgi:DNA-binding transcriptional regulator YhcF (GntR family)